MNSILVGDQFEGLCNALHRAVESRAKLPEPFAIRLDPAVPAGHFLRVYANKEFTLRTRAQRPSSWPTSGRPPSGSHLWPCVPIIARPIRVRALASDATMLAARHAAAPLLDGGRPSFTTVRNERICSSMPNTDADRASPQSLLCITQPQILSSSSFQPNRSSRSSA